MAESSQKGVKTLWAKENLLVTTVFSKDLYCRLVKTMACLGERVKVCINVLRALHIKVSLARTISIML